MNKLCGIDEAGRGALAGPMVIAACVLNSDIDGLKDSKELSPLKRDLLFEKITKNSKYLIVYFSNLQIDELGIGFCLKNALLCFKRYFNENKLLFDGNLDYGTGIYTMVKADSKIKEVSAASILAKVSRDRLMSLWGEIYPDYGYEKHKGYGTKEHIKAIEKFGNSPLSRKSFKLKNKQNSQILLDFI